MRCFLNESVGWEMEGGERSLCSNFGKGGRGLNSSGGQTGISNTFTNALDLAPRTLNLRDGVSHNILEFRFEQTTLSSIVSHTVAHSHTDAGTLQQASSTYHLPSTTNLP